MQINETDKQKELWKDIDGYEGLYQVSNLGRIKSLDRPNTNNCIRREHILKTGGNRYLMVQLSKDNFNRAFTVHKLVAKAFVLNPFLKPYINHKNGKKRDNIASNLEWVTPSENIKHAFKAGLSVANKGSKNGIAKLTEQSVGKIKALLNYKTNKEIAQIFGVVPSNISSIRNGRSWGHIQEEENHVCYK